MTVQHIACESDRAFGSAERTRHVRRMIVFMIVALGFIMTSVDSTIVATALDDLQRGLRTTINWAGWTITAYSLGTVLVLPISGKLSERYGCFKVFLWSIVAFTAASLGCGLSDNIYGLIALRAVQAAGGAGFTPAGTALIVDHFGEGRDRAVGLFGSIFSVGAMIGPIFGGLFVTYWSWRGIFFVNVPVGVVVILLALRYIPRDHPRAAGAETKTDVPGIGLLAVGLTAGMLAATFLGEKEISPTSPVFMALLVSAVAALWAFFRHIERSSHPFITPRFIYGRGFGPVNLVNALYGGITGGIIALIPLYAINRYGLNALQSATLLIAQGVAAIALSVAGALILRRTGYRLPIFAGSIVIIAGTLLLALRFTSAISPYLWLAGSTFLVGAGAGAINPACRNAGLQLAPPHSATLAALRSMVMQIGTIVIVTIATAILTGSPDPGILQAWIFVGAALLFVVCLPLIAHVPEHHGSW